MTRDAATDDFLRAVGRLKTLIAALSCRLPPNGPQRHQVKSLAVDNAQKPSRVVPRMVHDQCMTMLKQVGALPVRKASNGEVEILLVTSRDTGRWVIPKGWPSKRMTDASAALREARQEAGVTGKIAAAPIGSYRYRKLENDSSRLIEVSVYRLAVKKERKSWPEKLERSRAWFDLETAARRVREPRLKTLIAALRKA